jgi:hypothetical protein
MTTSELVRTDHTELAAPSFDDWLDVSAMPADAACAEFVRLIARDVEADEPARRLSARNRLQAWLALPPGDARDTAALHDEAVAVLDPWERELLAQAEEDAARHSLTYEQFRDLRGVLPAACRPWLVEREATRVTTGVLPAMLALSLT